MIRPLRIFHRWAFIGIAVVVPILIAAALTNRTPQPDASVLSVANTRQARTNVLLESAELWRSVAIVTRVLALEDAGYEVELSGGEISGGPDLLLYWSGEASVRDLPESAHLLGPYSGGTRRFAIPAGIDPRHGKLVLYSLAHQSVFATAEVPSNGR